MGVNAYAILAEFDAALAELMNRAKPLSGLLSRANASADADTQVPVDESFRDFEAIALRIHELAVRVLAYASAPEPGVREDLGKRAEDLAALGDAHRELQVL